jgi:hypothetical protein
MTRTLEPGVLICFDDLEASRWRQNYTDLCRYITQKETPIDARKHDQLAHIQMCVMAAEQAKTVAASSAAIAEIVKERDKLKKQVSILLQACAARTKALRILSQVLHVEVKEDPKVAVPAAAADEPQAAIAGTVQWVMSREGDWHWYCNGERKPAACGHRPIPGMPYVCVDYPTVKFANPSFCHLCKARFMQRETRASQ